MRVAVVGATGTIGRPLARAPSTEHEVVGVARRPAATVEDGVEWIDRSHCDAPCPPRGRGRLPPCALSWQRRLRGVGSRSRKRGRGRRSGGRSDTDRLSRRARRRGCSLTASAQQGRDGDDSQGRTGSCDDASGRDDRRRRERGVRNDSRAREPAVARPLVEGLRVPTIAHDDRIWDIAGVQRTTFDEAIRSALLKHD